MKARWKECHDHSKEAVVVVLLAVFMGVAFAELAGLVIQWSGYWSRP
jgi:hypothetical protein